MIRIAILTIAVLLNACTAFEQKAQNYKQAGEMALNPQCIKILYQRDLGNASFAELRCTGKLCEEVKACEESDNEALRAPTSIP